MNFFLEVYEQALQTFYTPVRPSMMAGNWGISATPGRNLRNESGGKQLVKKSDAEWSPLWKVFEFAINILQVLGEEARPLGFRTRLQACCSAEKWLSESTQLKTKNYHLNSMWGMLLIWTWLTF